MHMKKNIIGTIISAGVIGILVWIAAMVLSISYMDWSFFIGLAISVVLFFFNSSGGVLSKGATLDASTAGWKVQPDNELKANVGFVFFGAVLYTIVSFIMMIITYY
ncbi:hypothetical protein FZC79_15585 [Rossellomorea vietnamensis]|uniref:Uncharacterized protein n=2 Tax=Rossellomorea vietnamensis TaxID=218284 RepID=A0A5D4KDI5_9BACI|nr:hypothetical protein FZC79_15585 [Rossellomorea vietnamensis]